MLLCARVIRVRARDCACTPMHVHLLVQCVCVFMCVCVPIVQAIKTYARVNERVEAQKALGGQQQQQQHALMTQMEQLR